MFFINRLKTLTKPIVYVKLHLFNSILHENGYHRGDAKSLFLVKKAFLYVSVDFIEQMIEAKDRRLLRKASRLQRKSTRIFNKAIEKED